MKIIISLIIVCLFSINVSGQNNELGDVIQSSLNSYVKEKKESINRATMKNKFYFSIDNYPPHFNFKDTIQGIPIKYINLDNRSPYKTQLKEGVNIATLNKVELEKNRMTISFNSYSAKLKNRMLYMSLYESMIFIYEYSCEKQEWLLLKTEQNGV